MTTPTVGPNVDELAARVAEKQAELDAAFAKATKSKEMGDMLALAPIEVALKKAKATYENALFTANNAERLAAEVAAADWLKANLLAVPEIANARELGCRGISITFQTMDGGALGEMLINVHGAKAPRAASAGNGGGGGTVKPSQRVRNKHTGEEYKTRDWLVEYGDEAAQKQARLAVKGAVHDNGLVTGEPHPTTGKKVTVGFQPHLLRMLDKPEIAADWELVRRFAEPQTASAETESDEGSEE